MSASWPEHGRGLREIGRACFGNLSLWEVVDARGGKLVGLAQRRRQHGVLLVAGVLMAPPPWERFEALGRADDAVVLRGRTVGCEALVWRGVLGEAWGDVLQRRQDGAIRWGRGIAVVGGYKRPGSASCSQ
ncbi:MAG: hypothetical protein ACK5RC_00360 [Curvibacter sp.]|jgi:hypothetical protein|nr:hypothetical protein [Curvibacter sp.]